MIKLKSNKEIIAEAKQKTKQLTRLNDYGIKRTLNGRKKADNKRR